MEDIKRRLELNNNTIKQQAIKKIYEQVLKIKEEEINESTTQTPELRFLWEKCGDPDVIVCTASCQVLLQLLKIGKAQSEYVLKGLLNAVPSAKNHPHPFITILTSRSDSWVLLNQQIYHMLTWPNSIVQNCAVEMLSPFLKFVLLEPARSTQFMQLRLSVLPTCLQAISIDLDNCTSDREETVISYFLNLVPCLQIKSSSGHGEAMQFITLLSKHITSRDKAKHQSQEKLLKILVNHILTLTGNCINEGLDIGLLIDILMHILRKNQQMQVLLTPASNWNQEDVYKQRIQHSYPVFIQFESTISDVKYDFTFHALCRNSALELYKAQVLCDHSLLPELVSLLLKSPSYHLKTLLELVDVYIKNLGSKEITNSVFLGLLYMPLLNILTSVDPLYSSDSGYLQKLASHLLVKLSALETVSSTLLSSRDLPFNISIAENLYRSDFLAKICLILSNKTPSKLWVWMSGLNQHMQNSNKCGESLMTVSLVTAVLCSQGDSRVVEMCLKTFETIAQIEPAHSTSLLPVLLYKMNEVTDPHLKLQVLKTIPKIATHKVSMTPILKSLQLIGGSPQLKALSIRLITALWKQQDRCFPYLQQLLIEKDFGSGLSNTGINEVVLAKAASIRDICELRPHQHGEDMVQPLSAILNDCTKEEDAASVSLALKGLYYLCEAEVIDIRTAWSVLAGKLSKDKRPLVVQGICELFSLVPVLAAGDSSYDEFTSDVLNMLWKFAVGDASTDPVIVKAAFEALAKFSPDCFKISHLPKEITKDLIEAALAELPEEFEVDESSLPAITGDCYIKMMLSLHPETQAGYKIFLTSLIHNEVLNMPRGVHHSASRRHTGTTAQSKAISSIPELILSEYENNKQPGLRPGLAAGLLFSYDPPMQLGRDGKPRKNHVAQFGKQYHQMLYTLINEIPIQPSDWHKCLLTPQAWTAFMDRCYIAYLEGRKADLQLELIQGKAQSTEENQLQQDTAWLWARDKLTDLIKSCSRGSPTSQGNSVCALVGLAVTTCKYVASLDQDLIKLAIEEATEYTTQSHWVTMATNTVLAIMDFKYQPSGRIFSMCQQRTEKDRTPASLLARSGAAVTVSQLIPLLISINADLIYEILNILSASLPGATDSEDAGVIHFHYGLGMGNVLAALFEEKFLDVAGFKNNKRIWEAVDLLETSAFSESDTRMGSVFGLGILLSAMCKDGKPEIKVRVCKVQGQLTSVFNEIDKENTIFEAVCTSLASATASAYAANIFSQEVVDRTVANIYTSHVENPELIGASLALGMICSGLLSAEHPTVKDLHEKLFYTWITQIEDNDIPTLSKIAAMHGLTAIAGANNFIMQIPCSTTMSTSTADLVKAITGILHKPYDIGLKSTGPWLLGQFYLSTFNLSDSKSTVPSTYHYLSDTSTVKASVDFLLNSGKIGPTGVQGVYVNSILEGLTEGPNQALPPINWPSILSPLIRMKFSEDVERLCLQLAVKQGPSSPTAAMFISTWILSPLYDSLSECSKLMLYDSLPILIKIVAPGKLEEYLHHAVLGIVTNDLSSTNLHWCERAIVGVLQALQVNDPPQSITMLLFDVLHGLYHSKAVSESESLLHLTCKCLQEIPDSHVDRITGDDFNDESVFTVGLFTRCTLVGLGCQPLTWLNPAIESILYADKKFHSQRLQVLLKCFISTFKCNSEVCNLSSKTQWLLELMGHSKNIASGRIDLNMQDKKLSEVIRFLIEIFSTAVLAWCNLGNVCLLGIPFFTAANKELVKSITNEDDILHPQTETNLGSIVVAVLPSSLNNLLSVEPWKQLLSKIIDWLIAMSKTDILQTDKELQGILKGCLYSLRHTKDFNKISTWSQVYCLSDDQVRQQEEVC